MAMQIAIQVLALVLIGSALSPVLAHALEFPGKIRLSEEDYLTTQAIYYPGFTIVGGAEPLGMLALALVAVLWNGSDAGFWLTIAALLGLLASHAIYWGITHPVNDFWLKDFELKGAGKGFFGFALRDLDGREWKALRDRWEYSHIARAICVADAFVCFSIAAVAG
jgi:hypothetical protein